jgi:GNAT superfamily N-acetyltransferase
MTIEVTPLAEPDRVAWQVLARAYKTFYETTLPEEAYERTWRRLLAGERVHGLGARLDGRLVGIVHYLYHPGTWIERACYLEDLFVAEDARGHGVGGTLIAAVAQRAAGQGARRLYWLTHEGNLAARALYDRVARCSGFLEYEYPVGR